MHILMIVSIISTEILLLFFIYLFYKAQTKTYDNLCTSPEYQMDPEYCYKQPSDGFYYLMFCALALAIGFALFIILNRKNLKLGIGIIQIACKPLHVLKQFFLYPAMLMFSGIAILSLLSLLVLFTMSMGNIITVENQTIPGGKAKTIEFSEVEKYLMIFNMLISL